MHTRFAPPRKTRIRTVILSNGIIKDHDALDTYCLGNYEVQIHNMLTYIYIRVRICKRTISMQTGGI